MTARVVLVRDEEIIEALYKMELAAILLRGTDVKRAIREAEQDDRQS